MKSAQRRSRKETTEQISGKAEPYRTAGRRSRGMFGQQLIAIILIALWAGSYSAIFSGQDSQRDRRVTTAPAPTPQPSPAVTPAQLPSLASSMPARAGLRATPTRTLTELQSRIVEILRKPELAAATVGIKVASLDTGRVLFEENADKLLRPASNMKLYTVSAALDRLTPDFRFTTSVYAAAKPNADGVVHGDLTIYGRGDPSIAARFNNGDYFKGIDDLATKISEAGVKRVEGDLVGDESYFTGPQYGAGWEWEDLQWWYGAEVSALTVNDNALDLFVKPGLRIGAPGLITTGPPDPLLKIVNRVTTGAKGAKRELSVYRGLGQNEIEISGIIALDDAGYTGGIGISHPALLFVYLLRTALAQHGITVTGTSRTESARRNEVVAANAEGHRLTHVQTAPLRLPIEIAKLESPPFSSVAAHTLKPSQNLYTELILRTLGKTMPPPPSESRNTDEAGLEVIKTFLKEAGVKSDALILADGSGLSMTDMITASASVQLLTYMSNHKYANALREALPIAGIDGTLRNRFKGTVAENNLRAKTGTLSSAASLSGYVTTAAGEHLVFSIMVNNYSPDAEPRVVCIDPIGVLLASFAGRS